MEQKSGPDNRTCEELLTEFIREMRTLREVLLAQGNRQAEGMKGTRFGAGAGGDGSPRISGVGAVSPGSDPSNQADGLPAKETSDLIDHLTGSSLCEALARIDTEGELTLLPKNECACKAIYENLDEIPRRFLTKRTVFRNDKPCETHGKR